MLTGQVGLLRNGKGFIPKAIAWATFSHTYHVVIAISETECISAEPGGVRVRPITDYGHIDWSNFDLTDEQRLAIVGNAVKARNLPYNYAIYPFLLVAHVFKVLVPDWIANWLSRRPNVDCSQLCDDIYLASGIDLFTPANILTTPGDFERYFVQHGWLALEPVTI